MTSICGAGIWINFPWLKKQERKMLQAKVQKSRKRAKDDTLKKKRAEKKKVVMNHFHFHFSCVHYVHFIPLTYFRSSHVFHRTYMQQHLHPSEVGVLTTDSKLGSIVPRLTQEKSKWKDKTSEIKSQITKRNERPT